MEDMSQKALENAALSPLRFSLFLKQESDVQPCATRLLETRFAQTENTSIKVGKLEDFHLVPGGRFLVSRNKPGAIHLWDLGVGPTSIIRSSPLASLATRYTILNTQSTSDGQGIRVIMSSRTHDRGCVLQLLLLPSVT